MSHHSRTRKSRRAALLAGGVAAVLLPLGLARPAIAGTLDGGDEVRPTASTQQSVTHSTATSVPDEVVQRKSMVVTRVTEFYERYITATGQGNAPTTDELRQTYLDADLVRELEEWEAENHADGVTRSQNVPVDVDVAYDGSGMGKSHAIVTLHWDGGTPASQLHVETSLRTEKITDIAPME